MNNREVTAIRYEIDVSFNLSRVFSQFTSSNYASQHCGTTQDLLKIPKFCTTSSNKCGELNNVKIFKTRIKIDATKLQRLRRK